MAEPSVIAEDMVKYKSIGCQAITLSIDLMRWR